nr:ABC transporter ATP-binding protein/permease [Acidobacteriota bacterium]
MRQLGRLLRYVRPYWPHLGASVVLMALVGLLDAFRLLLIGPMLDRVLNPASGSENIVLFRIPGGGATVHLQQFVPSHFHNAWTVVAFALVASTALKGVCDYLGTYLVNYAGFGLITDLRNHIYDAVLKRSVAFFQKHTTGTLLSTIINDIEKVQFAMSTVLGEFLQQFFILLFTAAVVVLLGRRLAWVLLLFIPFIFLSARRIGRRVRSTTRRGQDKLAEVQNILHETITGNRIVKAFSMELWESLRFRGAAKKLFRANLRSVLAFALTGPVMDLVGAAAIALLLLLGRDHIKTGYFSAGIFVAFIVAVFKLYDPVRKFAIYNNNFQQALGASAAIFQFLDEEDEVREKHGAARLPAFRQAVRFESVGFSYGGNGDERGILRDVTLEVQRGEVVAIVGSSGAGKSTLVHLIPRFFDVSSGSLKIDGHDVREVTLASLRAQVGIVTQETILFNDTVRNNIAYGQPHVAMAQVEAAARAALAHDFISALPEGYD